MKLFPPPRLDFDIDVDQRHRRRGDAGDAGGMAEGLGLDLEKLLLHFAREPANRAVVEPVRNAALLGFLQAIDGALLLIEISGVLDFGLDRLEFVADVGTKMTCRNICGRGC